MPKTKQEQNTRVEHGRNMFFSINPAVLKSIFSKCSKKQLIAFGKEMKAMVLAEPNQLTPNQRRSLIILLRYCRKLYHNT